LGGGGGGGFAGLVSLTSSPYSSELFVLGRGWSASRVLLCQSVVEKSYSYISSVVCIVSVR